MPPWRELFLQLGDLSAVPAFIGLVVTASLIATVGEWRFSLWALLVQYVLLGVLHLRTLSPELALLKVLVGVLICPMLYWSARWVESERPHRAEIERLEIERTRGQVPLPPMPWPVWPTNWLFRLLAILLLSLVLYSVSIAVPLPFVDADIAPACTWLALIGLFVLVMTSEPLSAGMGLLTLVSGFDLFYDATSPGLAGVGVLAAVHLVMGLAISYLVVVRGLTGEVL